MESGDEAVTSTEFSGVAVSDARFLPPSRFGGASGVANCSGKEGLRVVLFSLLGNQISAGSLGIPPRRAHNLSDGRAGRHNVHGPPTPKGFRGIRGRRFDPHSCKSALKIRLMFRRSNGEVNDRRRNSSVAQSARNHGSDTTHWA